jgi:putative membrane protein
MKRVLFVLIALLSLLANYGYASAWERSFYWNWEPWGFGAGSLFMIPIFFIIAFWVVVIIGLVYFVKSIKASGKRNEIKPEETALDILKKRYAKGEISKEEFDRIKQDIQ